MLTVLSFNLMGQRTIYYDSLYTIDTTHYNYFNKPLILDFNDSASREYIFIDTTQQNNVWVFDTIDKPGFLVSDSIFLTTGKTGSYDTSLYSSFIIKIKTTNDGNHKWFSSFGLGFIHKYETDSSFDGLIVEASDDGGLVWYNAINEIHSPFMSLWLRDWDSTINWNTYSYIPNTNISINSGKSDSLIYSRLAWGSMGCKNQYDSLLFRISFRSDNIDSHKPGWAIQKIIVEGNFFETGGFDKIDIGKDYQIYSHEKLVFIKSLANDMDFAYVNIYSLLGQPIISTQKLLYGENSINLSKVSGGIYFVEIVSEKGRTVKKIFID